MWIAHALTLARIPLAIALYWAYGDVVWSVLIVAAAALTDTLDGNVARAMQRRGHTELNIGGWLDPLMDKIFVAIGLGVLWWHARDWRVLALIGARELLLVPLMAIWLALGKRRGRELHADWLGKVATIAQFAAITVCLAAPPYALAAAGVAAAFGLAAVAHYIVVAWHARAP